MLPKPELACFVIADISGYTKFLAASEIEHAQDIIADFMDTVVKGRGPPSDSPSSKAMLLSFTPSARRSTARSCRTRSSRPISSSAAACVTSSRRRAASAKLALRWAISISSSSSTTARW